MILDVVLLALNRLHHGFSGRALLEGADGGHVGAHDLELTPVDTPVQVLADVGCDFEVELRSLVSSTEIDSKAGVRLHTCWLRA